jgi:phosphoglucosamine mutase
MSRKLFGTDGVRGIANLEPMTAETALRLAEAAAAYFRRGDHRHRVVIGKDTRLSGYLIEPALTAGFISMGMDVFLVGPMPTPALAMLTRAMRCDLGVVISASHNPFEDNGIKLFGPDGYKLSDEIEAEIERRMENGVPERAPSARLGRAQRLDDAPGRYIEFVKRSFPNGLRLDGLKIAIDCANGAAYKVAPTVLFELGASVVPLGVSPDGFNINRQCGATSPDMLREQTVTHGCDLGIALDGDADRVVMVDEKGEVVDGDQLMALIASSWHEQGRLAGKGIVTTVMSNLGLERFLQARGLAMARTAVGDRYVLEHMRANGFNVGGEQSGHIILSDYASTGDGLIAALQVLGVLVSAGRPASAVTRLFTPVPQVLKSVRYDKLNGAKPLDHSGVKAAIAAAQARLGGNAGRLLIRKSGTEPVIRVMAEGDDAAMVKSVVEELCATIQAAAK